MIGGDQRSSGIPVRDRLETARPTTCFRLAVLVNQRPLVAVSEKLERLKRGRLAREAAKLDRREERSLADELLTVDEASWPEY